jgi:plasmid stabilization system protein ParE
VAKITWTNEAERWLEDIFEYIAADNPVAAEESSCTGIFASPMRHGGRGRPLNKIVMRRRLSIVATELSLPFGHCADQADEEDTITSA